MKGALSPAEAVTKLLEGTKLKLQTDSSGALLISEAGKYGAPAAGAGPKFVRGDNESIATNESADSKTAANSAIESQSEKDSRSKFTIEEVVVRAQRYGAKVTTVGRLATSYIDTPQAVSVVTSDFLQDAKLFGSNEALQYVPSVVNGSQILNTFVIRGFGTDYTYTDGFRNTFWSSFDTFLADRIEIVKGPSSTSFGRGDPAGFINYISKRPTFSNATEVGLLAGTGNGSHNVSRAMLDQNGLLSDDSRTAYRFDLYLENGAQSMDFSEYRKGGAQVAVGHNFNDDKGRLDVIASYTSTGNPGVVNRSDMFDPTIRSIYQAAFHSPVFPLFRGNTVLGLDGEGYDQTDFKLTAILDYKLGDHWRTRQALNSNSFHSEGSFRDYNSFSVSRAADGTLMMPALLISVLADETRRSWQSDFLGEYDIKPIGGSLSLLFGGDLNTGTTLNGWFDAITAPVNQPLYAWNSHLKLGPFLGNPDELGLVTTGPQWSYYAQGQLKFFNDKVQVSAAARKIKQDQKTWNRADGSLTVNDTLSPVMPMYSVLVKPMEWLSLFATTSKYIEPARVQNKYVNIPPDIPANDPIRFATITIQPNSLMDEIGVKAALLKERLTLSLTHYNVRSSGGAAARNIIYLAPDGTNHFYSEYYLTSMGNSGWEIEGFGQISHRLTFMFGGVLGTNSHELVTVPPDYAVFTTAKMPDVRNSLFGYATYSLGDSRFDGLNITAGWKTILSGTLGGVPDVVYPKDQNLFDLGLSYGFKDKYEAYVKANNITHKEPMYFGNQSVVSGRQVFAGINARF